MEIHETVTRLPLDIIEKSCGFSLDLGGSAWKVAYRSNKDYKDGRRVDAQGETLGPLHLALFPRYDVTRMIAHIRDNCDMTSEEDGVRRIHTTGLGANQFRQKIETDLNVKLENRAEFPCFSRAIRLLQRHLPTEEVFTPHPPAALVKARERLQVYKAFDQVAAGERDMDPITDDILTGSSHDPPAFPIMVVVCGSAFLCFKMEEDGHMDLLEVSSMGGRFHSATSALLTGVKSFDALMDMTQEFDGKSVDTYASDLLDSGTQDMYSELHRKEIMVFPFGNADKKPRGDIKDGDIVQSLTSQVAENVVSIAFNVANSFGIKKMLFCGNFVRPDCIKPLVSTAVYVRNARTTQERRVDHQYLRDGGHLGVIGAFSYSALEDY